MSDHKLEALLAHPSTNIKNRVILLLDNKDLPEAIIREAYNLGRDVEADLARNQKIKLEALLQLQKEIFVDKNNFNVTINQRRDWLPFCLTLLAVAILAGIFYLSQNV